MPSCWPLRRFKSRPTGGVQRMQTASGSRRSIGRPAGGSILGLMMLGAAKGDTIDLIVAGDNAEAVMAELSAMIEDGFGEP